MAFKEATPFVTYGFWREKGNHTILGAYYVDHYRVRAEWAIDNTGGESPPATYSHPDFGDCELVSGEPGVRHHQLSGIYTAIYEGDSARVYT